MSIKPSITITGIGSDITNQKSVQRRAKCKFITQTTMLQLIDIAKEKGANDRVKAYWNTYHCQNNIIVSGGRLFSPLCKNRFCTYCCGVRKAELVKKYLPIVQEWEDPYFVTLTIKAVRALLLSKMILGLNKALRKIIAKYRKKAQRNKGDRLIGLKTVECNFNPQKRTYNPHLHLLVPSKRIAEILINEWLTIWTAKYTHRDAQHFRKVENRELDLIEIIKYESKIFTEPDSTKNTKRGSKIFIKALYNIHTAMKGVRLIDRIGFNTNKITQRNNSKNIVTSDYTFWKYNLRYRDWITEEHESTLTGYIPDSNLEEILDSNIDSTLE